MDHFPRYIRQLKDVFIGVESVLEDCSIALGAVSRMQRMKMTKRKILFHLDFLTQTIREASYDQHHFRGFVARSAPLALRRWMLGNSAFEIMKTKSS